MNFFKLLWVAGLLGVPAALAAESAQPGQIYTGKIAVDKATFILAAEKKAHPPLYYVNVFLDSPAADGTKELQALRVYLPAELQTPDGPLEYGDRITFDLDSEAVFEPMKIHPFTELKHVHIVNKGTQQERDFANRK